jgi:hypothetical protein
MWVKCIYVCVCVRFKNEKKHVKIRVCYYVHTQKVIDGRI